MNAITLNIENADMVDYLSATGNVTKGQTARYDQYARPTFAEAFVSCFKEKYLHFGGRTRRSEYWMAQGWVMILKTANLLASISLFVLLRLFDYYNILLPVILCFMANFIVSVAQISSSVRRIHDTGRRGIWVTLFVIPLALFYSYYILSNIISYNYLSYELYIAVALFEWAIIILFVLDIPYGIVLTTFLCRDSEPKDNRYGESEKYIVNTNA